MLTSESIHGVTCMKYPLLEMKRRHATQVVNDLKQKRQVKFISTR